MPSREGETRQQPVNQVQPQSELQETAGPVTFLIQQNVLQRLLHARRRQNAIDDCCLWSPKPGEPRLCQKDMQAPDDGVDRKPG